MTTAVRLFQADMPEVDKYSLGTVIGDISDHDKAVYHPRVKWVDAYADEVTSYTREVQENNRWSIAALLSALGVHYARSHEESNTITASSVKVYHAPNYEDHARSDRELLAWLQEHPHLKSFMVVGIVTTRDAVVETGGARGDHVELQATVPIGGLPPVVATGTGSLQQEIKAQESFVAPGERIAALKLVPVDLRGVTGRAREVPMGTMGRRLHSVDDRAPSRAEMDPVELNFVRHPSDNAQAILSGVGLPYSEELLETNPGEHSGRRGIRGMYMVCRGEAGARTTIFELRSSNARITSGGVS